VDELYAAIYFVLAVSFSSILIGFLRRSEFGVLVCYAELFPLFGAFLYPIFFYGGFLAPAIEGSGFLGTSGKPGIATLSHVACYLIGALCGVRLASVITGSDAASAAYVFAGKLISNERAFFRAALFLGLSFLTLYLILIGWSNAVAYAAAMRSGVFENIEEEDQRFLFVKSLAFSFTFIVCFMPSIFRSANGKVLICLYVAFVLMLYAVSISRTVILLSLVVPFMVYVRLRAKSLRTFALLCAFAAPLMLLFLVYGKPLGFVLFKLLSDGELVSVEPYLYEHGFLSAFFGNFEFVWFSIEAGVKHFFSTGGPLIPADVLLSTVGFVPSRVLDYLRLSFLDYRTVLHPLSCVNTQYFTFGCTIPPRDMGFAAYVFPLSGSFLLGCAKYFVFRRQEMYFIFMAGLDYRRTWYPFLMVILTTMLVSFIPTVLSQLVFLVLMLTAFLSVRSLLRIRVDQYAVNTHETDPR
jgi:hypothetical protein